MRIEDIELLNDGDRSRLQARVIWEDVDRPDYDLFFEVDQAFGDALALSTHPFLVGCIIPAVHFGERRIAIAGGACAELLANLQDSLRILDQWFPPKRTGTFSIEPSALLDQKPRVEQRWGVFFTGGVDASAALRLNRLRYPISHSRSFKDGILVFGLEQDDPKKFELVRKSLEPLADAANLTMIAVDTNVYLPYREEDKATGFQFWAQKFNGAALAAVGHALAGRLTGVGIAASQDLATLDPWGTHPILDGCFGSSDLQVSHEVQSFSRLERSRLVAGWKPALDSLRVCNHYKRYDEARLNCGACEKCVRTMLTLLAINALHRTDAFPVKDLTASAVRKHGHVCLDPDELIPMYKEILPGLQQLGRKDLVREVRIKIFRAHWISLKKLIRRIVVTGAQKLGLPSKEVPVRSAERDWPSSAVAYRLILPADARRDRKSSPKPTESSRAAPRKIG
jgi:hypothetical protein